jgi:hypothetical protein
MPPEDKSPIKGIENIVTSNILPSKIAEIVLTLDEAAASMLKQFGQGQAMADLLRGSMADSVTSVRRLGGDIEDVLNVQEAASRQLGRNIILSEETTKDLYATMKVTGQEVSSIVENMANAGISSGKATEEMKKVVDVARQSGVNAQLVSEKVLTNMEALNKYNFEGGVQGLAKMAAQATSLRIDMSQTLEFAEKVFNPEGAIEVAAAMQRLGVSQSSLLDPLKLMDLSQNDPAELQNQIAEMSKQFVQLGKDGHFEIMPGAKRQLREVEQAMGLTSGTLAKMALGSADLDKKLKEISFPSTFSEDDRKMIANMAEMGSGGTYQIKTASGDMKDVDKLSGLELEAIKTMANTAPPTMEELAKQQLSATQAISAAIMSLSDRTGLGVAKSQAGGTSITALRGIAAAAESIPGESLESKNIAKGIDKFTGTLNEAIAQYANSGTVSAGLGNVMSEFGSFIKTEMITSFSNVKIQADKLSDDFPVIGNLIKSVERIMGVPLSPAASTIPSTNVGTSSVSGSQSSSTPSKFEITHNLNVKVDSNSANFDAKQAEAIFKSPEFMEKMTVSLRDGMSKMIPGKNEQLRNPGIS